MATRALSHAQQAARSYASELVLDHEERWKRDHDTATACRDLEENLPFLTNCLKTVVELRALELKRALEDAPASAPASMPGVPENSQFSQESEKEVDLLFRTLVKSCSAVNDLVAKFERDHYEVAGASSFRSAWEATRAISTVLGSRSNPRPVTASAEGHIFDNDGTRIFMPGLEPEDILAGLSDVQAGRIRALEEVSAEQGQ
jgi:hypothetical protein